MTPWIRWQSQDPYTSKSRFSDEKKVKPDLLWDSYRFAIVQAQGFAPASITLAPNACIGVWELASFCNPGCKSR